MASIIKLKRSTTASAAPSSLSAGELAINTTDKKLYSSDGSTVFQIGDYALANTNAYIASVAATELSHLANTNAYIATKANSSSPSIASPSIASPTLTGTTTDNSNALSQTLTDGATINWNVANGRAATVTLGGNRTMAAPTNLKVGTYILRVYQDATGSRSLTWNSVFKWTAAVAPVLSTTGTRLDVFSFYSDGTNLYGSFLPDMR